MSRTAGSLNLQHTHSQKRETVISQLHVINARPRKHNKNTDGGSPFLRIVTFTHHDPIPPTSAPQSRRICLSPAPANQQTSATRIRLIKSAACSRKQALLERIDPISCIPAIPSIADGPRLIPQYFILRAPDVMNQRAQFRPIQPIGSYFIRFFYRKSIAAPFCSLQHDNCGTCPRHGKEKKMDKEERTTRAACCTRSMECR